MADDQLPDTEDLAARLKVVARMAGVGKLSAGAAHEMNQPLNVIRMAAYNLRRAIEKGTLNPKSALTKLQRIDEQIDRAARLVGGMKAFSPTSSQDPTTINPSEAVATALELLAKRFSAVDVTLDYSPTDQIVALQSPPTAIQEVVAQVVDNTLEAFGPAPQIDPFAGGENTAERKLTISERIEDGQFILCFEDVAGGMSADVLANATDAFVTTDHASGHAGLGLTICRDLVLSMDGEFLLESVEGGLRVVARLPVTQAPTG